MKHKDESKPDDKQPSPTVTFYNGDTVQGNAMGSMADRQGGNSGRFGERQGNRGCER